jgi:hypothetical protein
MSEMPLEPGEEDLILVSGSPEELGVENRLLGEATDRQMTFEIDLEDSHHIDGDIFNKGTTRYKSI